MSVLSDVHLLRDRWAAWVEIGAVVREALLGDGCVVSQTPPHPSCEEKAETKENKSVDLTCGVN